MAKRQYDFSEEKVQRYFKEGRGQGTGRDYKPFLKIHDLSSIGRSSRVFGVTTGRIQHFLSDLERAVAFDFDWLENVVDVREQFPLDRFETQQIAEQAGLRHPVYPRSQRPIVMTTDLVVDIVARDGARRAVAICVKMAADLANDRVLEKLEIERRYWEGRGVPWFILTEQETLRARTQTLIWLNEAADLSMLSVPGPGHWEQRCGTVLDALAGATGGSIASNFKLIEDAHGWEPGTALFALRHLAAHRRVLIDVDRIFDVNDSLDLLSFPRAPKERAA